MASAATRRANLVAHGGRGFKDSSESKAGARQDLDHALAAALPVPHSLLNLSSCFARVQLLQRSRADLDAQYSMKGL